MSGKVHNTDLFKLFEKMDKLEDERHEIYFSLYKPNSKFHISEHDSDKNIGLHLNDRYKIIDLKID